MRSTKSGQRYEIKIRIKWKKSETKEWWGFQFSFIIKKNNYYRIKKAIDFKHKYKNMKTYLNEKKDENKK